MAKKQKKPVLSGEPQNHKEVDFSAISKVLTAPIRKINEAIKKIHPNKDFEDIEIHNPTIDLIHEVKGLREDFQRSKDFKQVVFILDSKNKELVLKSDKHIRTQLNTNQQVNLLRFLAGQRGYIPTEEIIGDLQDSYSSLQSLSKAKAKINQNLMRDLELENEFIQGQQGSGYRISPRYHIELKRTV